MNPCKNCVYWLTCEYVNTREKCEWQKTYVQQAIENIDKHIPRID